MCVGLFFSFLSESTDGKDMREETFALSARSEFLMFACDMRAPEVYIRIFVLLYTSNDFGWEIEWRKLFGQYRLLQVYKEFFSNIYIHKNKNSW